MLNSSSKIVSLLSATAMATVTVHAQPLPASSAKPAGGEVTTTSDGSDIIVTARRRDERLQDVPASISAVPAADMQRYNVTSIADVAKMVPQFYIQRNSSGTGTVISLRGVGASSTNPAYDQDVSLNIDGLSADRANATTVGYLDMAQLEVLKGPQALYFGKNSPAGVISIRSADPTDEFEVKLKSGYEFEARQAYGEAVISGPISDTFKARLALRGSSSEGYFRNTAVSYLDTAHNFIVPGASNSRYPGEKEYAGGVICSSLVLRSRLRTMMGVVLQRCGSAWNRDPVRFRLNYSN